MVSEVLIETDPVKSAALGLVEAITDVVVEAIASAVGAVEVDNDPTDDEVDTWFSAAQEAVLDEEIEPWLGFESRVNVRDEGWGQWTQDSLADPIAESAAKLLEEEDVTKVTVQLFDGEVKWQFRIAK